MKEVLGKAEKLGPYMRKIRHTIHKYPEVGLKEFKTTKLIKDELEEIGIEVLSLGLETGLVGLLEGSEEGPTLALRADIDALPMQEATHLPYASVHEGIMHACGHDGHTAVLLGAARLLSSMKERLKGRVLFIFQPAEETLFGALKVVETEVLEEYRVSMILGLHGSPLVPLGKIGFLKGPAMAAADKFTVTIRGRGGHGAYPHNAIDPLLTASQTIVGLQSLVSRTIDPLESLVLSVGKIKGGEAFNVIPEEVSFSGTVRTLSKEVQSTIEGHMERIIAGHTSANNCQFKLEYTQGVPVLDNDPSLVEKVISTLKPHIGCDPILLMDKPFLGSEDYAFFLERVPGIYFHLGLLDPAEKPVMLHNEGYDFNDEALPLGAGVLALYTLCELS